MSVTCICLVVVPYECYMHMFSTILLVEKGGMAEQSAALEDRL